MVEGLDVCMMTALGSTVPYLQVKLEGRLIFESDVIFSLLSTADLIVASNAEEFDMSTISALSDATYMVNGPFGGTMFCMNSMRNSLPLLPTKIQCKYRSIAEK
jgi:hypothetical protein